MVASSTPIRAPPEHVMANSSHYPTPSSAKESMDAKLVVDLLSDSLQLLFLLLGRVVVLSLNG